MPITIFDPDERRRNNQLAFLQQLKTFGELAQIPGQLKKQQAESKFYESLSGVGSNGSPTPDSAKNLDTTALLSKGQYSMPPLNSANLGSIPLTMKGLSKSGPTFGPDALAMKVAEKQIENAGKIQADRATKAEGAQATTGQTGRYLKQYDRSMNELKRKFPEIDKVGFSGWMQRQGAKALTSVDEFPETKALQKLAQPFAQQLATEIEGRATDEDRRIQTEAFADVLKAPSETNIRLASMSLLNLKDKGADISKVLKTLDGSKNEVMRAIVKQVYEDSPELEPKPIDSEELLAKWSK